MSGDFFNKDEQEIIGIAVEQLSSVCDNAQMRDYIGFNRADASVGHHLASLPVEEWTDTEYMYCWTILFKYRNQLEKVFGTSIDNLYQNRLSILKEKSKNQNIKDLKSIKKLKSKDDSHIRNVLKNIGDTLKDYVNGKDIIHFNEDKSVFEITQNKKNHSESFLAAMHWIHAVKEEGETYTRWIIEERFKQAVAYIVVKLIGKNLSHLTKGTLEKIKEAGNPIYDIENLTKSGFDQRDYMVIHEGEHWLLVDIFPRGSYGGFTKLSHFNHKPDMFMASASIIYMKDLRAIKSACSKKNYRIIRNNEEIGFFGLKNMFMKKPPKNPISLEYVSDTTIRISGDISLLNSEAISKAEGVELKEGELSLEITFKSLKGIDKISRMLKPLEIKLTYSKFSSDLLMSNSERYEKNKEEEIKESLVSENESKDNETSQMKNCIIVDIDQDTAKIRFPYNEEIIKLIKDSVHHTERAYQPKTQEWFIKGARKHKELMKSLQERGLKLRER